MGMSLTPDEMFEVFGDHERAMNAGEEHRRHIDTWFYECSHDMHRGLAQMYLADPRFTAYYEGRAEGLAAYLAAAIGANADRCSA